MTKQYTNTREPGEFGDGVTVEKMTDEGLVAELHQRATLAEQEGTATATVDARYFRTAADRLSALTACQKEVERLRAASIWHCMDEKTQAEYGPWVRAADHQAALDATKCGESPYPWKDTRFVPGTSKVSPGVMLMDGQGACIGFVSIMNAEPETHVEVARALSTAGDIARTRRHLQAARKGEEENGLRAETAEADRDRMKEALTGIRRASNSRRAEKDGERHEYYYHTADAALNGDPQK